MKTKFVDSNEKTVFAVINYMENNIGVQTDFYSEVIVLLKLYLVSPATNAVSERSPSSMPRIKNWLRTTVSQERLNYGMLLSIHKEKTVEVNLKMSQMYFVKRMKREDIPLVSFVIQTLYSLTLEVYIFSKKQLANVNGKIFSEFKESSYLSLKFIFASKEF